MRHLREWLFWGGRYRVRRGEVAAVRIMLSAMEEPSAAFGRLEEGVNRLLLGGGLLAVLSILTAARGPVSGGSVFLGGLGGVGLVWILRRLFHDPRHYFIAVYEEGLFANLFLGAVAVPVDAVRLVRPLAAGEHPVDRWLVQATGDWGLMVETAYGEQVPLWFVGTGILPQEVVVALSELRWGERPHV